MEYNSGSNQASDLKLRARLALNCTAQSPITNNINCVDNKMQETF